MKLILILLLLTPINGMAQEQVILKKAQLAPYKGVLVPEDIYKQMYADIETKDLLQKKLDNKIVAYEEYAAGAEKKQNWFFGAGAVLGVLIGVAVAK